MTLEMTSRGIFHKARGKIGNPLRNEGIPKTTYVTTVSQHLLLCPCCNHSQEQYNHGQMVGSYHELDPDMYSSDEFRMYHFKVHRCQSIQLHDWTECPFLHPGEKARRRDLRKYAYSSELCTEFRKIGKCPNSDNCQFAHGVFEVWLHPNRYRTQLCRDGIACRRKVCFFAHTTGQLRWPSNNYSDGMKIDKASALPIVQFDSAYMPKLSSLVSALVADKIRLNDIDMGALFGIAMLRDSRIEMPDINWVSELVDF